MEDLITKIQTSAYFIIAEIGMNHDGSLGNAYKLIEEAKNAGVNAVKFQLHISSEETLKNAPTPPYFQAEKRYEYFERTSFSLDEWKNLLNFAHEKGLFFIVSPFSHKAVDLLEKINVDAYKIASGETTNLPLLEYIESKNKPIFLSTGMSNWKEIFNAIDVLKNNLLVIFQCSSLYPCPSEKIGLNIIKDMKEKFKGLIIGYSDHTLSNISSIGAYIMGAKVFEIHFTLSKKMYGADAKFSLEPKEMLNYVNGIKLISNALNNPINKDNIDDYKAMKLIFEKSIVAAENLNKGKVLKFKDFAFKKPGDGIRADRYKEILGKKLLRNISKNDKFEFNDLNS
ncbi:MAG: N-acetylneuraminate synthase family protein [Promethearchaeota archaeon]